MVGIAQAILDKNRNNGSDRAQAENEYKQAMQHYTQVMHQSNDPKTHDEAHERMKAAAQALGKAKFNGSSTSPSQ